MLTSNFVIAGNIFLPDKQSANAVHSRYFAKRIKTYFVAAKVIKIVVRAECPAFLIHLKQKKNINLSGLYFLLRIGRTHYIALKAPL